MSEANAIRNAVKAVDDEMRRLRADLAEAKRLLNLFTGQTRYITRADRAAVRTFLARSAANDK